MSAPPRRPARRPNGGAAPARRVQPARRVAYDVLRAVSNDDAYANLTLPAAITAASLSPQDAALATELTYGALRRRGTYDAVIASAAARPTSDIDPAVLDALRLATHQLLATRVASHAAVNESVNLVSAEVGRGPAGFANAVLRRISRDTPGQWQERIEQGARSDDERLGLRTAHPVWIIRALRRALTAEGRADELEALLESDNVSPEVTLVALPGLAEPGDPAGPTRRPPSARPAATRRRSSVPPAAPYGSRTRVHSWWRWHWPPPDRSHRGSGGSTCARARAAKRPCSQPSPTRTTSCSKPTRSSPPAPVWSAAR